MKKGILIIFSNDENILLKNQLDKFLTLNNVKVCLINNGSSDKTLQLLERVKANIKPDVFILDIRRSKGKTSALKAGARYLFNKENIKFSLFLNAKELVDFNIKKMQSQLQTKFKNFDENYYLQDEDTREKLKIIALKEYLEEVDNKTKSTP